jgi:phosphatidyl-myo-inositol alpha-mannosyltransferase
MSAPTKLKIGFVIDDTLDKPDGVQQYVLTLGEWLRGQGHEVHFLAGASSRTDVDRIHSLSRNVGVVFNGNRLSIPLPASGKRLTELLEREQFDILHIQMPYSPMLAAKIVRRAPQRTAVFGTFHILPQTGLVRVATHALGMWLRSSLKRFDQVFAVSPAAKVFAQSAFGLSDVTVLPNVVHLSTYQNVVADEAVDSVPTIMFLGRLVPRKGCATLLDAVAELRKTYDGPFRVVICGKGPLDGELKAQAARLGIADIVDFAGFVSEAEKPKFIKQATVMAFPSTGGESFGIVLIEAMAASDGSGPVVLAASNPGYASVLEPKPELLFAPGDSHALAEKLALYLRDETARRDIVAWQQAYVRQFDVAEVGRQLEAAYTAQLQKKRLA